MQYTTTELRGIKLKKPDPTETYSVDVVNENTELIAQALDASSTATNVSNGTGENSFRMKSISVTEGTSTSWMYNNATGKASVCLGGGGNTTRGYSSAIIGGEDISASGNYSFGSGKKHRVEGEESACFGKNNTTKLEAQFVIGKGSPTTYSTVNGNYDIFVVGNGTISSEGTLTSGSAAFKVRTDGTAIVGTTTYPQGADYAEFFEWEDGNSEKIDRVGLFVTIKSGKIHLASEEEPCIGITSAMPSVCGNAGEMDWCGKYKKDIFGRYQLDENGERVLSDDYDDSLEYVPRSQRPEWAAVGMVGQLVLIDDGTAKVDSYVKAKKGGIGTFSETPTRFLVMERLDDTHVKVLVF